MTSVPSASAAVWTWAIDAAACGSTSHLILQLGQFVGDVRRQQIAACRQRLAELDENRSEFLECEANSCAQRFAGVTGFGEQVKQES